MADAWTTLLTHSTLNSGDAWEHLNAQEGGGGGDCGKYVAEKAIVFSRSIEQRRFAVEEKSRNANIGICTGDKP